MFKFFLTFAIGIIAWAESATPGISGSTEENLRVQAPSLEFRARRKSVDIFFVTNRQINSGPIDKTTSDDNATYYDRYFAYEVGNFTSAAVAQVDFPEDRARGTGGPGGTTGDNPFKYISVANVYNDRKAVFARFDRSNAYKVLVREYATKQDNPPLVYVHGFNNSLTYALINAARLKEDTANNNIFVFSWPGDGQELPLHPIFGGVDFLEEALYTATMYYHAQDQESKSHFTFASMLTSIESIFDRPPNVLAHSMGAKLFLDAVGDIIIHKNGLQLTRPLAHSILAAPDIDPSEFYPEEMSWTAVVGSTTVFCTEDRALMASMVANISKTRIGYCHNPPPSRRGTDTYYVSKVSGLTHHGYYLDTQFMLDAIKSKTRN